MLAVAAPEWSTACLDWRERIKSGKSIIPAPIFSDEAEAGLAVMKALKIVDAPGSPTIGDACAPWVFDLARSIFGSYDAESGRRLIQEWFVLIPKKNSKALALDTPIPTPSGWSTMGELQAGDTVFGADGEPCRVVAVSPMFTDHKCYRLGFSNGESVVADAGHLWRTSSLRAETTAVRTTQEIVDTISTRADGARNHSMPMPMPIRCEELALPVAPYTLGAWLGDGHSASAQLTCHESDAEILDSIRLDGWPVRFASNNGSKASTYALSDGDRSQAARDIGLASKLRAAGVLNDKHIPSIYFRASFKQRLALLQGLMDTDGSISKSGRVLTYTGVNERLVRGVSELLSTLGVKSSVIAREVKCNGRPAGIAHFVQFMAFRDSLPAFRLNRKLERMRWAADGSRKARSQSVHIVSASEVPSVPVKCISVDSQDKQFLFGRSMLPTHNSTVAAAIMLTALIRNWRSSAEFISLAPTLEIANNSYAPARDMVQKDDDLDVLLQVQAHYKTITHRTTNASLKVVAADNNTVGGKKAVGILIDEAWLFGKVPNAENMLREATGGLASRPEGFVIWLTTQSDDPPSGIFKQKLQYARDVRDGKVLDPQFVPVIYEFPETMIEGKNYLDTANFALVNPNMNYSVDPGYLEREFKKAENAGEESMRGFLAKHLNVEIGLALKSDAWAGALFWDQQSEEGLSLQSLLDRCEVVTAGIDGGGLDDMLGMAVVGREKDTGLWLHWAHAWLHPIALERRKKESARYRDFEKQGDLTIVEKVADDVKQVAEFVMLCDRSGKLERVGCDPSGIGSIIDALLEQGFAQDRIAGIRQGWNMVGAIKTTERKLAEGAMKHCGTALMNWCVGNAKVEPRGNALIITKQAAGSAKIDPLLATFNAVTLMSLNPEATTREYKIHFLSTN